MYLYNSYFSQSKDNRKEKEEQTNQETHIFGQSKLLQEEKNPVGISPG